MFDNFTSTNCKLRPNLYTVSVMLMAQEKENS